MRSSLSRRVVAEFLGTAFLVAAIIGSGIMGERLANGNAALALLANTIATGAALVALILAFRPISGAHLNPIVSLAEAFRGSHTWSEACLLHFWPNQRRHCRRTACANAMFALPIFVFSHHALNGSAAMAQ